jgi:hypothetical protein
MVGILNKCIKCSARGELKLRIYFIVKQVEVHCADI